jgi:DNA-binding MarR family transcriptional regulator
MEDELTLELLDAVEKQEGITQRSLAQSMGIALGLANSYLKKCINRGLVKTEQAPANRYHYSLTPKGFSEKARLTGEYLSSSFGFYRQASDACARVLEFCQLQDYDKLYLIGCSELAEICRINAVEQETAVAGIIDSRCEKKQFMAKPVYSVTNVLGDRDLVILSAITDCQQVYDQTRKEFNDERILVPDILFRYLTH